MRPIARWPAVLGAGLLTAASWLTLTTGPASAAATSGAATAPTVHVTLIDPASADSNVGAINDAGATIGTDDSGAFWYDHAGLHRLDPPAGVSGILLPVDIDNQGDILAQVTATTDQVYLWRHGRWIFIADGDAAGMNEHGQILVQVGTAAVSFLLWQAGRSTVINAPDVTGTPTLTGGWLNQAGQVAFTARDTATGNLAAWLWTAGRYTRLPALVPGTDAQVSGLNDLGEVVGQSGDSVTNGVADVAVTWQHGRVHRLATPSVASGNSVINENVTGVNDRGQIVGTYSTATGPPPQQDVIWEGASAPATQLDPGAWAADPEINRAGQVIFNVTEVEGIGQYHDEGFAWLDGQLADLGEAFPIAENASGEVSMDSESSSGTFQAALATIDWGT